MMDSCLLFFTFNWLTTCNLLQENKKKSQFQIYVFVGLELSVNDLNFCE